MLRAIVLVGLLSFVLLPQQASAESLAELTPKAIKLKHKITFAWGNNRLRKKSYPILAQVSEILRKNPKVCISIEGHSDSRGSKRYNKMLTQRRACALRQYLIAQEGIAGSRMKCVGHGESRPIMPNVSNRHRKLNRRMEFLVVPCGQGKKAVPTTTKPPVVGSGKPLLQVLSKRIKLHNPIAFRARTWKLHPFSLPTLKQVAHVMKKNQGWTLRIEGHTSRAPRYSIRMSYRRACEVKKFLVSQGVQEKRMKCIGYGDTRPIAPNRTAQGRQKNRRIELILKR